MRTVLAQWDRFRLIDDPQQWILERQRPGKANGVRWDQIVFHRERAALQRNLRDIVGVDWGEHLPEVHP